MAIAGKDLLSLKELTPTEIKLILDTAEPCKEIFSRPIKKFPTLRGKVVVNLFYEPSTRTRTSFELAGKWMSADVVNISVSSSSVVKGETLKDTAKTLEALGADLVVIRHQAAGTPHILARCIRAGVINAGDGAHEHPTQGLLDLFTIREHRGGESGSIEGMRVVIVGDILHSRVARSDIWGLRHMGAEVTVCGPPTLMPPDINELGVRVTYDLDEALKDADVVNVLRIQRERQSEALFPTTREYARLFGVTKKRLLAAPKDILIMHPGPANLGVEITQEVVDLPHAVIGEQVTNGVAVRMALLYLLSGGVRHELTD